MDIRLKIQVEAMRDTLTIRYALQDTGESPLYVVDAMLAREPNGQLGDRLPHVDISRLEDEVCGVFVRLWPRDPTVASTGPPITYAHKLRGGDVHTGAILLPVPVRTTRPRWTGKEKQVVCKRVRLELGIVPDSPKLEAKEFDAGGHKVYSLNSYAWDMQTVVAAESGEVNLAVVVPE